MEEITILKCYEYRILGEEIKKMIPIFPEDIFYNWWRKYKFAFDLTRLAIVYIKAFFDEESQSTIKHLLVSNGFNPTDVFKFVKNIQKGFSNIKFQDLHQEFVEELEKEKLKNNSVARLYLDSAILVGNTYKWMNTKSNISAFFTPDHINMTEFFNFTNLASQVKIPAAHHIFSNHSFTQVQTLSSLIRKNKTTIKTLFGEIYTDLKCNEGAFCLNCALFDNYLYAISDAANTASNYYTENYTVKVTPEFKQYWINVTEYNLRYIKGSRFTSSTNFGSYEINYYHSEIYPSYRNFDYGAYISGLWEGTREWSEILINLEYFVSGNYTGKIPSGTALMFGPVDLQYVLEWPFQQQCTDGGHLYDSKIDRVGYGIVAVVVLLSSYFVATRFIFGLPPEPLNFVLQALVPILSFILYITVVYQYNFLCLPSMNVWLFYDFLNYIEDFLFLDCFCSYLPFLFKGACSQAVCDSCAVVDFTEPTYYSCQDAGLVTGFNELGFAWHFVFTLRWFFQDTFIFFYDLKIWPLTYFYEIDGVKLLVEDVKLNLPVTGVQEYCFYLHIGVPISILLALYILFLCALPFLDFLVFYTKQVLMIIVYLIAAIYQLGKTLLREGLNTD